MLTVVMLNWGRPTYVLFNLRRYASYGIVKQILCFNNGTPLISPRQLPAKCVLVESSTDLGLYSRLAVAALAGTDAIFHTDDDIGVPESTMQSLYRYWLTSKLSCHGLHGRVAQPVYRAGSVFGPVEVILTRALVCGRRVNNVALSSIDQFDDLEGQPRGNGEDIILSFAAMALSRSPNFAYRLPSEDYPDPEGLAIHRRWPDHYKHRQLVVTRSRVVFFGAKAD
jgi:hypothetical protein